MMNKMLIDKSALIEQIKSIANNDKVDKFKAVKFVIENAPAIEAEPVRHGRWIEGASRGSYSIYCSYCGSHKETICPSDYCPDCGARMDAEDINVLDKDGGADNG